MSRVIQAPIVTNDSGRFPYKWRVFAAVGLSLFTSVMSFSMTFVALAAIADDYDISLRTVSWVVIIQSVVISALMMPMGRLGDIAGRKKLHLGGLFLFGLGALMTAFAPSFSILLVARVVTSVGNAMGQSVGTGIVVSAFPESERGKAIGSQTTAVGLGGASGPIFAGFMLQFLPWEWIFIILLIPIAVAFVAGLVFLRSDRDMSEDAKAPFDKVGAFLSAGAIVLLVFVINNPVGLSWVSLEFLLLGISFALIALAFVLFELRVKAPMLELRMFRNRNFSLAVITRLFGFGGATAMRFLVPVLLISLLRLNEALAGAILLLTSIGMAIAAQAAGRLTDRFGPRPFAVAGFFLAFVSSMAMLWVGRETSLTVLGLILFINGLSMGLWNVPNNAVILGSVSDSELGIIGAFTNLTRNLGNVVGQALSASVVAIVMVNSGFDVPLSEVGDNFLAGESFLRGTKVAYGLVSVFALVSLVLATRTQAARIGVKARTLDLEDGLDDVVAPIATSRPSRLAPSSRPTAKIMDTPSETWSDVPRDQHVRQERTQQTRLRYWLFGLPILFIMAFVFLRNRK